MKNYNNLYKELNIPTEFDLMSFTIKVVFDDTLSPLENNSGYCSLRELIIKLQPPDVSHPKQMVKKAFYHELVHAILSTLERRDYSDDEILVDNMAQLLSQFEKTKKFNL